MSFKSFLIFFIWYIGLIGNSPGQSPKTQVLPVTPGLVDSYSSCTYKSYEIFLKSISDTSRFEIVPLYLFNKTNRKDRVIIGIRHDMDHLPEKSLDFASLEFKYGIRSTYFVLHTAKYYREDSLNFDSHSARILAILKKIQDEYGHEVGLHTDLVTVQAINKMNPEKCLAGELNWLKNNGVIIYGTAAHGSPFSKKYHYSNDDIFTEIAKQNHTRHYVVIKKETIRLHMISLKKYNLYEAYFLNNDTYFSDIRLPDHKGIWLPFMLDLNSLKPGQKIIILIHPEHWYNSVVTAH